MENLTQYVLYLHACAGGFALVFGAIAIFTTKGKKQHTIAGRVYFWAMTCVFITGIFVASYRFNRFLFLIAFLSYYSVFAGVRLLKLKKLHKGQNPRWYDWAAGMLNAFANLVFIAMGVYYMVVKGNLSAALLSIGFGVGGLAISYTNLKPFVVRPTKPYHWYMGHMGNMMGGYIATTTAFFSTVVSRVDFIPLPPALVFAIPPLVGVPALLFWLNRVERSFQAPRSKLKA